MMRKTKNNCPTHERSNLDSLPTNSLDADDSVESRSSAKRDTTKILSFVLRPPLT